MKLLILSLVLFVTGCASSVSVEQMTASKSANSNLRNKLEKQYAVIEVSGGKTQFIGSSSKIENDAFKSALMNSLSKFDGLDFNSNYVITAEIHKVSDPLLGFNFEIEMAVHYSILNKKNNIIMYSKLIESKGKGSVSEAFLAFERMAIAKGRAAKNNIEIFLQDINDL